MNSETVETPTIEQKLNRLAEMITEQQKAAWKYTHPFSEFASVKLGKKYAKVDVGTSGKYMVEMDTQRIFGIKAYGVIHRGHQYGTLDTIDDWDWSGYVAHPKTVNA